MRSLRAGGGEGRGGLRGNPYPNCLSVGQFVNGVGLRDLFLCGWVERHVAKLFLHLTNDLPQSPPPPTRPKPATQTFREGIYEGLVVRHHKVQWFDGISLFRHRQGLMLRSTITGSESRIPTWPPALWWCNSHKALEVSALYGTSG